MKKKIIKKMETKGNLLFELSLSAPDRRFIFARCGLDLELRAVSADPYVAVSRSQLDTVERPKVLPLRRRHPNDFDLRTFVHAAQHRDGTA